MAIEPPPNIMKAGQRPAKVRTGAKTATKVQERETLERFDFLTQHPEVLVPDWLGRDASPFEKLERKLRRVQGLRGRQRRLRWAARGKHLWNAYAVCFLVLATNKVPSFASIKFQERDVKFVYRSGTGRHALIGVQHYDEPEVRLLGYHEFARKQKLFLLSGERLTALRRGTPAPEGFFEELFRSRGLKVVVEEGWIRCPHATGTEWHYEYTLKDLDAHIALCLECVQDVGGSLREVLDRRILGPDARLKLEPKIRGHAYTLRPDASIRLYEELIDQAFESARAEAEDKYSSYSDVELAQWTKDHLVKLLEERIEGFLLVGDDLWLIDFDAAADAYVDADLERRALKAAFALRPPKLRVSDKSLHKIIEPYWKDHGRAILTQLSGGLLKEKEIDQIVRLNPSEALASLARILGSRERFKEFLQFDELPAPLDFLVTCLQIQRAGEHAVLSEKLHAGAKDSAARIVALSLARAFGAQATLEWQYSPHEKDGANFLDPYVKAVVAATPAQFPLALARLAQVLGVKAPSLPPVPETSALPSADPERPASSEPGTTS